MGCFTRLLYLVFVVVVTAAMIALGTMVHEFIKDGMQPRASLGLTAREAELVLWAGLALTWLISVAWGRAAIVKG